MRSSTSSSEQSVLRDAAQAIEHQRFRHSTNVADRAPEGPWLRTWALALLITAVALACLELVFRRDGLRPSVRDEAALWASVRSRASGTQRDTIALLGSSRFQLGVDPAVLNAALATRQVLQLSIDGASPVPVLGMLADDPTFRGTALVEVTPGGVFGDEPAREAAAHEWIRFYQNRTWLSDLEAELRVPLQSRSVLLMPGLKSYTVERLRGRSPPRPYVQMRGDRCQVADYSRAPAGKSAAPKTLGAKMLAPEALRARIASMARFARAVEARGGRVVFVRMLATGDLAELEEREFPRSLTWDVLVRETGVRGLHVDDVPELGGFECPDGSHLDYRDAPRFTRALAAALRPVLTSP